MEKIMNDARLVFLCCRFPVFEPLTDSCSELLPATFLLKLQPPLPMLSSFIEKMGTITGALYTAWDLFYKKCIVFEQHHVALPSNQSPNVTQMGLCLRNTCRWSLYLSFSSSRAHTSPGRMGFSLLWYTLHKQLLAMMTLFIAYSELLFCPLLATVAKCYLHWLVLVILCC